MMKIFKKNLYFIAQSITISETRWNQKGKESEVKLVHRNCEKLTKLSMIKSSHRAKRELGKAKRKSAEVCVRVSGRRKIQVERKKIK